jgi:hypothetical protein
MLFTISRSSRSYDITDDDASIYALFKTLDIDLHHVFQILSLRTSTSLSVSVFADLLHACR